VRCSHARLKQHDRDHQEFIAETGLVVQRVILIGLSGTGKSSLAPKVAREIGYSWVDTDQEISERFGTPIPDVFENFGESTFRSVERDVIRSACERDNVVIATGGGAVLDESNWSLMRPGAVIIHLRASTEEIVNRLKTAEESNPADMRPLLAGGDPEERITELWKRRKPLYDRADIEVETDGKTPDAIVTEIVRSIRRVAETGLVPVTSIDVPGGRSDIYAGAGISKFAAQLIRSRWPETHRVWLVTDTNIQQHWAGPVRRRLHEAGFSTEVYAVEPGEASKSFRSVEGILDWLIRGRVNRGDILVALGGGVVGDLAGFAASIALRGINLVQMPTSLLAMVDSSVGGKTGVNHELGKNLIGAFYQPHLVIADTELLQTLPDRELCAGWAEVVKHGMIERSATGAPGSGLLEALEQLGGNPCRISPETFARVVAWNINIKAEVVRQDERESGHRWLLNYGHTFGHAMEAAEYRYIHGEAVALGLRAAARLGRYLGMCDDALVERQDAILNSAGLPQRFEGDLDVVLERMTRDKKAVNNRLTWILPVSPGVVGVRQDVPIDAVVQIARQVGAD
jgi:shikimate kinase / 3-dehydroquinate synthase